VLNAVLIYYIVHLIYLVYKEEKINLKDKIILFILTILIAMFKYIYILVAGILFLNLFKKKDERKEWKKTIAIMICLGSVFMIGWFVFNLRFDSTSDNIKEYYTAIGIDSTSQIQYIKEHPARFVKVILRQFIIFGTDSLYSAIGSHLGWLNVEINSGVILGFFVLTLYAVVSEENNYEFNTKSKIWILLIYVAISTLIKLGMYLYSTPVGNDMVCGVQGRYYTPILILPILCLIKKDKNYKVKYLYEKVIVVSLFLSMFTIYCVIRNYI
jgi:uncharacterized membrane protein